MRQVRAQNLERREKKKFQPCRRNVETWQQPNGQKSCSSVVIQQPARVCRRKIKRGLLFHLESETQQRDSSLSAATCDHSATKKRCCYLRNLFGTKCISIEYTPFVMSQMALGSSLMLLTAVRGLSLCGVTTLQGHHTLTPERTRSDLLSSLSKSASR